jgi:hypothetical protein
MADYLTNPCWPTSAGYLKQDVLFYKTGSSARCITATMIEVTRESVGKIWVDQTNLEQCFVHPDRVRNFTLPSRHYLSLPVYKFDIINEFHVKCFGCDFYVMTLSNYEAFKHNMRYQYIQDISKEFIYPEYINAPQFLASQDYMIVFFNHDESSQIRVRYYMDVISGRPRTTHAPTFTPSPTPASTLKPPTDIPSSTTIAPTAPTPVTTVKPTSSSIPPTSTPKPSTLPPSSTTQQPTSSYSPQDETTTSWPFSTAPLEDEGDMSTGHLVVIFLSIGGGAAIFSFFLFFIVIKNIFVKIR